MYGVPEEPMEVQEETVFKLLKMFTKKYKMLLNYAWQFLPAPPLFSSCTPTLLCKDKITLINF